MPDPRGFLDVRRVPPPERDPRERVADYREIYQLMPWGEVREQARRCMGCGVPFCHDGCPVDNLIPEWNDLVRENRWREALDRLHFTNDFPEFTGFICPAPCESACVLEINDDPVTIKQIELSIIERGWEEGWVVPAPPEVRTGRSVAVVGSGPAGMACANQLNRRGHSVTVLERDEGGGGLLRFGIPDHKLEKRYIDRRFAVLEAEGIDFRYGVDVGRDVGLDELRAQYDAVVLAIGARQARPLTVPGIELEGVHLAMDYLYCRNRAIAATMGGPSPREPGPEITARGKHVVVIGGGDTGADCISNAHRERAASVTQLDTYPEPAGTRPREIAGWPRMPRRLPTNYALDEGGERRFAAATVRLEGEGGRVTRISAARADAQRRAIPGTEAELPCDLALIAIGFSGVEEGFGLALSSRSTMPARGEGELAGVFACGDAVVGASLVVTAIAEGRRAARDVAAYLAR